MKANIMDKPDFHPQECDIVMEGGITSGVIYPSFISGLAKHFRLRSIGGTSVGAIAATAAAAAQFRRNQAGSDQDDGFDALAKLPEWLQQTSSLGLSNLFSLFQPCPPLKPHFKVLQAGLNRISVWRIVIRVTVALVVHFPLGALAGAIALAVFRGVVPATWGSAILSLAWAMAGMPVGALAQFLWTAWFGLQRNRFGICPGLRIADDSPAALTEWLHGYIQRLAGLPADAPLTFGQLWASKPSIDLALMSTGISELRAHRLPYEDRSLMFRKSELLALFPPEVVAWLVEKTSSPADEDARASRTAKIFRENDPAYGTGNQNIFHMPNPEDLPVVVAARMSLSFPVLLQAVPLYRLRYARGVDGKQGALALKRVWFSDGGLTSNFPIHLFDALLPQRPTFGITLESTLGEKENAKQRVRLPDNNISGILPNYLSIEDRHGQPSIFGFAAAILNTMRTWRHEALKRTPGYRDRIVVVRHTKQEGGLNLNMPAESIARMGESGIAAANAIVARFLAVDSQTSGWINHRWVRMRSTAGLLQAALAPIAASMNHANLTPSYREMWDASGAKEAPSYKLSTEQRAQGSLFFDSLVGASTAAAGVDLNDGAPHPQPSLTVAPREI